MGSLLFLIIAFVMLFLGGAFSPGLIRKMMQKAADLVASKAECRRGEEPVLAAKVVLPWYAVWGLRGALWGIAVIWFLSLSFVHVGPRRPIVAHIVDRNQTCLWAHAFNIVGRYTYRFAVSTRGHSPWGPPPPSVSGGSAASAHGRPDPG